MMICYFVLTFSFYCLRFLCATFGSGGLFAFALASALASGRCGHDGAGGFTTSTTFAAAARRAQSQCVAMPPYRVLPCVFVLSPLLPPPPRRRWAWLVLDSGSNGGRFLTSFDRLSVAIIRPQRAHVRPKTCQAIIESGP